jgi:hypothetical protein
MSRTAVSANCSSRATLAAGYPFTNTTTPFAGITISADAVNPCRPLPSAKTPPPLPAIRPSAGRGALDHENRKTPISKPAANAQRPNVQAETTRTRLRRSCGISWD